MQRQRLDDGQTIDNCLARHECGTKVRRQKGIEYARPAAATRTSPRRSGTRTWTTASLPGPGIWWNIMPDGLPSPDAGQVLPFKEKTMAKSRHRKQTIEFEHSIKVKVRRITLHRSDSLEYLDIDKLSRAAKAGFEVGHIREGKT